MGLNKRIWIDRDPVYEDVRRQFLEYAKLHEFTHRIPRRQKNRCPVWPRCLDIAAARLNFEHRRINGGVCFRTEAERDAVRALAEALWEERLSASVEER